MRKANWSIVVLRWVFPFSMFAVLSSSRMSLAPMYGGIFWLWFELAWGLRRGWMEKTEILQNLSGDWRLRVAFSQRERVRAGGFERVNEIRSSATGSGLSICTRTPGSIS